GPCGVLQDLLISGACFQFQTGSGVGQVTSVFAIEVANPANKIQAQDFTILGPNLLDAHFNFTSANAGKKFIIQVVGPGGTSRGIITPVAGAPAGCALGNELGCLDCIAFTCNAAANPNPVGTPGIAVVTSCHVGRADTGQFFLDITVQNAKADALVTVGGLTPKKIKVVEVEPGTTNPTKLR